jgi:hypothetical protein
MGKRLITLCYRKIIDINSRGSWEQMVFEDTYTELLMQLQNFNPRQQYQTFSQLMQHVPEAAKLHFLVSSACVGYLQQLYEKIPDIMDNLGRRALQFKSFHFELINSDFRNIEKHQIAISFFSPTMLWLDTIGNALLVSALAEEEGQIFQTILIPMVPYLAINSLQDMDPRC